MTKLHYIADESLGGIMREYAEVARKADVGDFVIITSSNDFTVGTISKCAKLCDTYYAKDGSIFLEERVSAQVDGYVDCSEDSYRTLEPTDIVQIDGERFELADRKAKVGEKVLIVTDDMWHDLKVGTVAEMGGRGVIYGMYVEEKDGSNRDYLVLVPVSDEEEDSTEVLELLANLARRVTSLESQVESLSTQLRDTQRNIETFAQQTEHNSEDIRELDERTQVIGAINSYYGGAR